MSNHPFPRTPLALACCLTLLVAPGCGSSDDEDSGGEGQASFNVYGEDYIEQEIPGSEFEDGWTITYSKFLIEIGNVTIADANKSGGASEGAMTLVDLTKPGPQELWQTDRIASGGYDTVSYMIGPVSSPAKSGSVTDADVTFMTSNGYGVYVEGSATNGTDTKTFAWGFKNTTHYMSCVQVDDAGNEVRQGILVANGGVEKVQLTVHGDHLFYDDLTSENAVLRFNSMAAADADSDGEVTREELASVELFDITEGSYGTGSASEVNTLDDFVQALTSTIGHFRGEGHCVSHSK
ncbi:MAG: hypothetical protein KC766_19860 [Myxococcales bacterium]|nr:hypothetical protein [Myxococcales bacterium]